MICAVLVWSRIPALASVPPCEEVAPHDRFISDMTQQAVSVSKQGHHRDAQEAFAALAEYRERCANAVADQVADRYREQVLTNEFVQAGVFTIRPLSRREPSTTDPCAAASRALAQFAGDRRSPPPAFKSLLAGC